MLHPRIEEAFDEIDAAVFNGDSFHDETNRRTLRDMVARWERRLAENDSLDRLEANLGAALRPEQPVDWEAELNAILDQIGPDAVRVKEGGGKEDLLMSLSVTLLRLQNRLNNPK